MDTLQLVIDSISKIAIIPQSISQGISPQPIACLDALHKLGVVLIALFNLIFSIYLYKTNKINQKIKDMKVNRQNLLNILIKFLQHYKKLTQHLLGFRMCISSMSAIR